MAVQNSISGGGLGGTTNTVVANFSELPDPTLSLGKFYFCENSQGIKYIGAIYGGTYRPAGQYYSNGVEWKYQDTPSQATQPEVDAGVNTEKYINSTTFNNAGKWNTKYDASNPNGFETASQLNTRDSNNRNRANHSGTQLSSTISDIQSAITNNSSVVANTAKITNATHTGEVTGATALILDKTSITNKTNVVVSLTDNILISDTSDTGNLKKTTVQSIIDLAPNGGGGGGTLISAISVLNFFNEEDKALITVSNTSITNSNIKSFSFIPVETSETSLDDFSLNGLSFSISNIIDNVSFDIIGTAINDASGNYTIKYLITI